MTKLTANEIDALKRCYRYDISKPRQNSNDVAGLGLVFWLPVSGYDISLTDVPMW